jgi:hypothetical protein
MADDDKIPTSSGKGSKAPVYSGTNYITGRKNLSIQRRSKNESAKPKPQTKDKKK